MRESSWKSTCCGSDGVDEQTADLFVFPLALGNEAQVRCRYVSTFWGLDPFRQK